MSVRLFVGLLTVLFSSYAWAQTAALTKLSADPTEITLSFNQPVHYKLFALKAPERLVIDFQDARYAISAQPDFAQTPIVDFRHGIQQGVNLRVVFDLKKSIPIESSITEGKNFQLIIKLPKPAKMLAPYTKKHIFTVVIDAGHGGKDPGTIGPHNVYEKNVTLAIARDLQTLVNQQPNMKTVMTRKGDYYVGLRQRLMIARKEKGDIFIAIHADAYKDQSAEGASVFALSLHGASSEAALWLAQKENYSELGGIDLNNVSVQDAQLRSVLIDLSQTATISASVQLGRAVIKQLGEMTALHHGVVEQAPFMVLKSPDIPSILVETGFLSNPKEESRLKSKAYQEEMAEALMSGISQYYSQTSVGKGNGDEDEKALSSSVVVSRSSNTRNNVRSAGSLER
ncbi:MAG TPA: N-acetylmuramoyl-L-alanine amidase [Gammaproteobacteria bacterium]|nr:N-acetylmuramoyl-L-alanine amidase [Gammaproteobacteria bacterium]